MIEIHNHSLDFVRPPGECPGCDQFFEAMQPFLDSINRLPVVVEVDP